MSMFTRFPSLAAGSIALLACAAALAQPAPAHPDQLASLINAYRAAPAGCGGRAAVPALTVEPALSQVRIGAGTFLESALRSLGYRAEQAEAISLTGVQDAQAAMDVLREKFCAKLLDPDVSAIGTAHSGSAWQIVLARPMVFPDLPGWEEAGQQILAEVNRARAQARHCGTEAFAAAPPVSWNGKLALAALGHSSHMAEGRYFSHQEPDGSLPADRALRAGYLFRVVGENIASGNRTPQDAVAAWIDSPGHCANLMNPAFHDLGAAYATDPKSDAGIYWTAMFGVKQ